MLKILARTLLLMIAGLLGLLALAVWVWLTQHRPAEGDPLRVSASADVILPWQQAELWIDYTGAAGEDASQQPAGPAAKPATLLFLLDTSSSMPNELLEVARKEILELSRNLTSGGQAPRVGVMAFNGAARKLIPFTDDPARLTQELEKMRLASGGGTSFIAGLQGALQMLGADTGAVVLITDGAGESKEALAEFYQTRWRDSGNELFLVGIHDAASKPESFFALTEEPTTYILSVTDIRFLHSAFDQVATRIGSAVVRNARLQLPLAGPLWNWAESAQAVQSGKARTELKVNPREPNEFRFAALFVREYHWRVPLQARLGGILQILKDPPRITYTSIKDGKPGQINPRDTGIPKILVISWWLLLLFMLLPALLYFIASLWAWLWQDTPEIPEILPPPRQDNLDPPPNLPLRVPPASQRVTWAPSLIIGLGRPGRAVLTHLRQNIADSFDNDQTRPLLLALDVARHELQEGRGECFAGCLERLDEDQVFMLPPGSCALHQSIHKQRTQSDDPAAALDLEQFKGWSEDALRLNNGTQGRAPLARLALLNDLAAGNDSALLKRLKDALASWRQISPEDTNRQLILVADVDYGIGPGWLTDLLVLLRRLVTEDEEEYCQAVEISLLLLGKGESRGGEVAPLNAPTLFTELDRLSNAGSRPFEHCLAVKPASEESAEWPADFLAGRVDRRPYDAAFMLPTWSSGPGERPESRAWAAAADAVMLLIDRERRVELTYQLQARQGVEAERRVRQGRELYTQLGIHSAVFPRSFFRAWLRNRLGRQLAGNQVLFPELKIKDGKPRLSELEPDLGNLCDADDSNLPEAAGPICRLLAGQSVAGPIPETAPDDLNDLGNRLRVNWLDTLNTALRQRDTGLLDLARLAARIVTEAEAQTQQAGNSLLEEWQRFADSLHKQCLIWLELFLGSNCLTEHKLKAQLANAAGFLSERSAALEREVVQGLKEWGQTDAREMIAPFDSAQLEEFERLEATGRASPADSGPEKLYTKFLCDWLRVGSDALADELADRCYWELTMPGDDDEPIGVNLVLRATSTYRYAPKKADLNRFLADISGETAAVLDESNNFHALALLRETLDDDDDEALKDFAERLRGDLRGDRSALLATLPNLDHIHDPALRKFHGRLVERFAQTARNAAEIVKPILVKDRARISVLQILPSLPAVASIEAQKVCHLPERLLLREAEKYAHGNNTGNLTLPPALGGALEQRSSLHDFARLYLNGQIIRNPLDDLWYARDEQGWGPRLTDFRAQTIADAAARFACYQPGVCLAQEPMGDPDDFESDFAGDSGSNLRGYFKWLVEKK